MDSVFCSVSAFRIPCFSAAGEFVDLNYIVASLIFCHFWHSNIQPESFFFVTV